MSVPASTFLRRVLALDAGLSAVMGAVMMLAVAPLSSLLGLPSSLLTWAGLILLPFAAFLGWLATREMPPRAAVWAVVICNVFWTVDSFLLLASGWVEPTLLGKAFVVFQAVVVALLAELEFFGLRRVSRLAAA
ncbi:MAG TPA: hypothetical protein VN493_05060 [Thermoanaerobaculia bacterium]|nr:hypothetical protein [Thermoanaerobaculia bacterium]